ncbi:MAG: hypothetical protein ACRCUT_07550 [Spirochaetota bacterium]
MTWAVVALTSAGAELGLKLKGAMPDAALFVMPGRAEHPAREIKGTLKEFTGSIFNSYDMIVFIMAAGIAVDDRRFDQR